LTRRLAVLALVLLTVGSSAEDLRRLGLDEALDLALRNNESVLLAEADREKAEGAVVEARAGALPQLSLEGSYQGNFKKPAFFAPEEFGGGKLEIGSDIEVAGRLRLDQVLYAFGRVGNALDFAGIYRDIAGQGILRARAEVVYQCREAYFRVALMQRLVTIAEQSHALLQQQLDLARQRAEQGTISRFELLRAEVELKNQLPERIKAGNDLALAGEDFLRVIGLPSGTAFELVDSMSAKQVDLSEEDALSEALRSRPEIRALELGAEGAEKILSIRKAGRLPVIGLFGQLALQGESNRYHPLQSFGENHRAISSSAGLALQIPVFDGFRTRGRIRQARADLLRSRYQLRQAKRGLSLEVRRALQDLRSLAEELESTRATEDLAEEAFSIARTRYESGLSIQLELNDARMAMNLARTSGAEALYRYNVALARLDRVLGRAVPVDDAPEKE